MNATPEILKPYKTPQQKPKLFFLLLFAAIGGILLVAQWDDFFEVDVDGNYRLSIKRKQKLDYELKELEDAEQYALKAAVAGWYPCYNCPHSDSIYLFVNEVWKYGTTRKGEMGRYTAGDYPLGLFFQTQFRGDLLECLKEEKRKIYYYVELPENTKRRPPIIRPPGNKRDY